jgi:hypothetical protein
MVLNLGNKCCNRGRLGVVLEPGYKYKPLVFVIGIEQFHNKPASCQLSSPSSRVVPGSRFYLIIFILCQFQGKLTGTLPDSTPGPRV